MMQLEEHKKLLTEIDLIIQGVFPEPEYTPENQLQATIAVYTQIMEDKRFDTREKHIANRRVSQKTYDNAPPSKKQLSFITELGGNADLVKTKKEASLEIKKLLREKDKNDRRK